MSKKLKNHNYKNKRAKKKFIHELKRKAKRREKRLGTKRHFNVLKSKHPNKKKKKRQPVIYSDLIEKFCDKNVISIGKYSSHNTIKFNSDFSLFDNPNKVLHSLREMLEYARKKNTYTHLSYEGYISFGALYLIDHLCWEIAKTKKWSLAHHDLPKEDRYVLSRLQSIKSSSYETSNEHMINERIHLNRDDGRTGDQRYKIVGKNITDMLNSAITEIKGKEFELPQEAYHAIYSTIGEHFDNINLHAPDADFGTLCGFYNKRSQEITLLIFNFGNTIYDTLTSDTIPIEMEKDIKKIVKNHTEKNFFQIKSDFSMENALTLLALQEGISSRIKYDKSRGHGLIDFAENCFSVSENSKIVIISGKTAIKIDKTYRIQKSSVLGRERRIIAFNDDNDIFEKPNTKNVQNLSVYFPGVLIETTIPLNY